MTLGRIVDEGAKVRGRAFAEVAKVRGRAFAEVAKVRGRAFAGVAAGVGLLLTAVSGSAATFTWNGNGADDHWDTTANWQAVACANCYPDDAGDDVTISGIFDVGLVKVGGTNLAIGDLTLSDTVILEDADGNDPTLFARKVTITGAEGGTTIKIKQKARLETN